MKLRILIAGSLVVLLGVAWVSLGASQKQSELRLASAHDRTSYLDAVYLDFVRPGLDLKLENPTIGADRRIRVNARIRDPRGLPLDLAGVYTPGPVTMSFVIAHLPDPEGQYVSYTTRTVTSPITSNSAIQASTDSGGSFQKIEDGLYRYTSGLVLPANFPASETHALGAYATRDLREFGLDRVYANDILEWVPDNSHPPADRAITVTANCNNCHDPLSAHGEVRRDVRLCVLCHTQQTVDPDTGNTVDFKVMIHKIHRGANLPSVQAGTPYRIIGFGGAVHDYSNVHFPDDVRNCERCHAGASQSLHYLTKPSRAACGACHDNVNFTTGANHAGIVQVSDAQCSTCHIPQGDLEFDVSIKGAHTIPTEATSLSGVVFEILGVDNGTPGNRPTVRFTIRNKAGDPIPPNTMNSLGLILAGPTRDYAGYVRQDARQASASGDIYSYTFTTPIAAGFRGSMAVGIEGYRNVAIEKHDGTMITARDAGFNKVFYFDTAGNAAMPRRPTIDLDGCNSCHGELAAHGGQRLNTEYCVLCHAPSESDRARRPADQQPVESIHFKTMIHKIHTGAELERDFIVYGFGGTAHNFKEIHFPGDRRNCIKCHIDGTQSLPLPETALPTISPRDWLPVMAPETAACLSCHTGRPAAVHAQVNQSSLGEACSVCHGPNAQFSVSRVHSR